MNYNVSNEVISRTELTDRNEVIHFSTQIYVVNSDKNFVFHIFRVLSVTTLL